ncbi:Proteasome subunit beta type-6 [Eumeta japonica]|uniref:proteasome endopeptidase complex n=1 Tax=Eumeta variegata TaxID=151549 RepID=A0A4C1UJK1_EUMVA|nr:Proteasome subunit beta type-6 [Eumeta japonica]
MSNAPAAPQMVRRDDRTARGPGRVVILEDKGAAGDAGRGAVGRKTRRRAAEHDAHATLGATPQAGSRCCARQIYSVPIGGMAQRQSVSIGGSGSTYVYGYVDANFKPNMNYKEAVQFAINTLTLAMLRDGSSGGVIRLGVITKEGVERSLILGDQLPKFYEN